MKILLQALLLCFVLTVQAGELTFNGIKPAVIVDVRSPQEFVAGHIEGAVNIPLDQVATGIQSIRTLKKDSTILVYCRSGRRSAMAQDALEQQGYKRVIDGGGMDALAPRLKPCTAASAC